jgi:peptidoglycan/LPS O-acetylase OafA/YrhL
MQSAKVDIHRIAELDGIRGIAVIWVMLAHFYAPFASEHPLGLLSTMIGHGDAGVDIFFVLSGYLITSILIATKDAENYLAAFYARRSLRIFPLYIVAMTLYFGIFLPLEHRHGLTTGFKESEQVWYWLFLGNWRQGLGYNGGAGVAHFWSLAIEEQFYLAFSLIVLWVKNRNLVRICIGMIAASILLRVGLSVTGHLLLMAPRLTVLHLDPIAMGALLACSKRVRDWANRYSLLLIPLGFIGMFVLLNTLAMTATGIAAAAAVARGSAQPIPILRFRFLQSFGKYSYALYVIHPFLAGVVAHFGKTQMTYGSWAAVILGESLASYALAWLSWNLLEKWFLRLKSHFSYRSAHSEEPDVDHNLITA